jgi:16S rRNA (cytidine1402-2'-O)-methyltransferase
MGTLFLVATPIGNLDDISYRALETLRSAVLIAAEDTRQTKKILQRYEIATPTLSYHEHNKISRVEDVLDALATGDVALVSDAGMPGLNDPGYELVQAALKAGYSISAIPGPSAPVMALVISGLPTDAFLFLGYLPRRRAERRRRLEEVAQLPYTLIFLEAPHRILEGLEDISAVLGDRPMAAARELTKVYEEVVRGTVQEVYDHFQQNEPRGEFTLVIGGHTVEEDGPWDEARLEEALLEGLKKGQPQSQLAGEIAAQAGWERREVYRKINTLKEKI